MHISIVCRTILSANMKYFNVVNKTTSNMINGNGIFSKDFTVHFKLVVQAQSLSEQSTCL